MCGHAAKVEKSGGLLLLLIYLLDRCRKRRNRLCQDRISNCRAKPVARSADPNPPLAVQKISYLHHRLLWGNGAHYRNQTGPLQSTVGPVGAGKTRELKWDVVAQPGTKIILHLPA